MKKVMFLFALAFSILFTTLSWSKNLSYKQLPKWSKLVMYMDISRAVNSPDFLKQAKKNKDIKEFLKDLKTAGINLYKDVKSVSVGLAEINPKSQTPPHFVVYLNMNYDSTKLLTAIKNKAYQNGKRVSEENISGYTVIGPKPNPDNIKMALLDGDSIIIANSSKIKEAINLAQGNGQSLSSNRRMTSVINSVNRSQPILWAVFELTDKIRSYLKGESKKPGVKRNPMMKNLVSSLRKLDFAHFKTDVKGQLTTMALAGVSKNKKSAADLADALGALKVMVKIFLPQEIGQKVKITHQGKSAGISISLTKNELDGMLNPKKR